MMENEVRLIDANALPYTRVQIFHGMDGDTPIVGGYNAVVMSAAIREAPTIDPESLRPKGRWVVQRENEISKTVYCTNCRKDFYIRKKGELQLDTLPYCPNCSAKMEG